MKVIALRPTFLKKRLLGSEDLTQAEKILIPEDKIFYATKVTPDRNQHVRIELASPLKAMDGKASLQEVFGYEPHLEFEGLATEGVIKLPVTYRSQLDNDQAIFGPGWRQCCTTSNAMLADFLLNGKLAQQAKEQGYPEPESLYMRLVAKYGDTTDHNAQTPALKQLGIESYWTQTLSADDLLASLRKGIPVVLGVAYKADGHIILCVGYDPHRKWWIMHDPYGTRHGASDSYDVGIGGAYDPYSHETMQRIFWDLGREAGYGRVVTTIEGRSTGLRGL